MSHEQPQGWAKAALSDIASVEWGNTTMTKRSFVEKGFAAYSAGGQSGFVSQAEHHGPGFVLGAIGTVGKCYWADGDWTAIKNTIVIKPDPRVVIPRFAFHYLNAPERWPQSGSSQQFIALGSARQVEIPFAPLNEQLRIVAKLEKVLDKVDAAQQRLTKIPILLKRFRQSILAAASSGRLTADWREANPNVETAEQLICKVSEARHRRLQDLKNMPAKKRPVALSDFDNTGPNVRGDLDLPEVPASWSWVDLRFMMNPDEPFCYGVVQPGEDDLQGPRLIRVCDMENGRVVRQDLRGIPLSVHEQYERSILLGGEVLVSVVGTIGRAAIASSDLKGVNIARAIAKIPVREFDANFVLLWLSTSRAETWMIGDAREVARKTLNLQQLRTLPVPLPPLSEQEEIVRRVEELFALADQIEARYAKAKAYIDNLTQSILAKAFRGELVPQDPNDEPASVLLERMRKERGSEPDKKRRTRVGYRNGE